MEPVRVLVGVPCGHDEIVLPFFASFGAAISTDQAEAQLYRVSGMNTCSARNDIVHKAITEKYDYIFFMDSDMEFPPATLERLLRRDKDIVGGFYVRKKKGFLPNAFKLDSREGDQLMTEFISDFREVEAIGTGCLLIKTEVFEKLPMPWFEYESTDSEKGRMATEDIVFCKRAKKAGYKIFCDGEIACGHVGMFTVTPQMIGGVAQVRIDPV